MILERITSPKDLRSLSAQELNSLAAEIRARIIEVVSQTGGHLASSLGTVELTIALHYCLDTPRDKIVWDVGHQTYAHKIITGRNKFFTKLRQYQGLYPFPCKEESEYDSFTTGHSSTAVSLALGLVCARDLDPALQEFKVAAVIGDGSLSGGLCFEGLNNAGHLKKDMVVILNTNELSIAPNVGALSNYLNKLISLPLYNRFKNSLDNFVASRIPKGSRLVKIANKFEEQLKGLFVPGMFFEELGFRYFGPFDGHNLDLLIHTFKNVLTIKGPRLVHVVTKKGKGYLPAETEPVRFHSSAAFDIASGKNSSLGDSSAKSYTGVFSDKIAELARDNKKIVAITAAMPEGTGLHKFRDLYPQRFFDVGIAEGHAVCFAGALATQGLKPVVAIYSTFLQRAYDQIVECVALQKAGVVFCLDRAGIVGEDGATHQGVLDIAFLRSIPNMVVMAPKDAGELEDMLTLAVGGDFSVSLRYPKAKCPLLAMPRTHLQLGRAEVLKEGQDFAVIALGSMTAPAWEACQLLEKEGLSGTLVNARFVKPLDVDLLQRLGRKFKRIVTVEDGMIKGGFGSAVKEAVSIPVVALGVGDEFLPCGSRDILLDKLGLNTAGIAAAIRSSQKVK